MANLYGLTNDQGVVFTAKLCKRGDRYGRNHCLVNETEDMIEFYDAACAGKPGFDAEGQFVQRYLVTTLYEGKERLQKTGLCLDGANRDVWSLTGDNMRSVFLWHGLERSNLLKEDVDARKFFKKGG